MMAMRIGSMRQRITIQRVERVRDRYGATTDTWLTLDTVWAQVELITGSEPMAAGMTQSMASALWMVRIRFREDVGASNRIVLASGAVLDIESIGDPDGSRRELIIMARERGV